MKNKNEDTVKDDYTDNPEIIGYIRCENDSSSDRTQVTIYATNLDDTSFENRRNLLIALSHYILNPDDVSQGWKKPIFKGKNPYNEGTDGYFATAILIPKEAFKSVIIKSISGGKLVITSETVADFEKLDCYSGSDFGYSYQYEIDRRGYQLFKRGYQPLEF